MGGREGRGGGGGGGGGGFGGWGRDWGIGDWREGGNYLRGGPWCGLGFGLILR